MGTDTPTRDKPAHSAQLSGGEVLDCAEGTRRDETFGVSNVSTQE